MDKTLGILAGVGHLPVEVVKPPIEEKEEAPFISVEEMPSFPGGEEALMKYMRKNIQYPAVEKDNGIEI